MSSSERSGRKCSNNTETPSNGTDGHVVFPKYWIVALTQMNREKKVASKLTSLGYECFVPVQREEHQWSDRKKMIDRIVIPMTVFVRAPKAAFSSIASLSFVNSLLSLPGSDDKATAIPSEQIEKFKFLLANAESEVSIVSNLHVGDKVKVISGPLKGFEGQLSMINKDSVLLAVEIGSLGYASVMIAKDCVVVVD